tara:strand:- start:6 stop:902 length:897 start_codon:yes stop_codon:yes gene_type:complete
MISVDKMTKEDISIIFKLANEFEKENMENIELCKGKILCNAFFEPSTRTSLSFGCAMKKLGGEVINFNVDKSSIKKGESLNDTMRTLEQFSNIIVLRHPEKGIVEKASNIIDTPIINGGDGDGEHPTQALLDLYTILKNIKNDKKINVCIIGDIRYSRTIHSLLKIIKKYELLCNIDFLCYPGCEPDDKYLSEIQEMLKDSSIKIVDNLNEELYDVIYSTRRQKERLGTVDFNIEKYQINSKKLNNMKEECIIMHPLPRNNEITNDVDLDSRAKYYDQVKNGVYIRMAIICDLLINKQ